MFSNVSKLLDEGEEIEATVHPSRFGERTRRKYSIALTLITVVAGLLLFRESVPVLADLPVSLLGGLFVIPAFIVVWGELERQAIMFHFTTKKFIQESGIMHKSFASTPYHDITRVTISQGVNDRMLGIGNLKVEVRGSDTEEIILKGIRDPQRFRVRLEGSHAFDDAEAADGTSERPMDGTAPTPSQQHGLTKDYLEAELGRITRKQHQLEEAYESGELGQQEYEQRWYVLQGRERQLEEQIDMLEQQAG